MKDTDNKDADNMGNDDPTDAAQNSKPTLFSQNRNQVLSFSLLTWESRFPCTRYDEWLISELLVSEPDSTGTAGRESDQQPEPAFKHQGPFILRYEVEEWVDALQKIQTGELASYESDFIEPSLKIMLTRQDDLLQMTVVWQTKTVTDMRLDLVSVPAFCHQTLARLSDLQDEL